MNFFYYLGLALKNIWRRFSSFLCVIVVLAVCLVMIAGALLGFYQIGRSLNQLMKKNAIVVFLDPALSEQEGEAFAQQVEGMDNVLRTQYLSSSQVYADLLDLMSHNNRTQDYLDDYASRISIGELGAQIQVAVMDYARISDTVERISSSDCVVDIQSSEAVASGFAHTRTAFLWLAMFLVVLVVFISLFLISSFVQLNFYSRREELAIMEVVGATRSFIRAPFLIEGSLLGLCGGLLALPCLFLVGEGISSILERNQLTGFLDLLSFQAYWKPLLLFFVVFGFLLGYFCAYISINDLMKKHRLF